VLKIAHRGASGRFPENTLAAFGAAIALGADMCELDVQLSRDSVAIVIHDPTIDRTTDRTGRVAAMTLAELQQADAGLRFAPQFTGERIPTLDAVLRLTAGRCRLNIELKGPRAETAVCALVTAHNALATTLVSSFDWDALARARQIAPPITIGLLASRRTEDLLAAAIAMHAAAINPRIDLVDTALCTAAHARGLKVYAWTCDDPPQMRKLIADGVDGIMTNYPDRLAAVMAS